MKATPAPFLPTARREQHPRHFDMQGMDSTAHIAQPLSYSPYCYGMSAGQGSAPIYYNQMNFARRPVVFAVNQDQGRRLCESSPPLPLPEFNFQRQYHLPAKFDDGLPLPTPMEPCNRHGNFAPKAYGALECARGQEFPTPNPKCRNNGGTSAHRKVAQDSSDSIVPANDITPPVARGQDSHGSGPTVMTLLGGELFLFEHGDSIAYLDDVSPVGPPPLTKPTMPAQPEPEPSSRAVPRSWAAAAASAAALPNPAAAAASAAAAEAAAASAETKVRSASPPAACREAGGRRRGGRRGRRLDPEVWAGPAARAG
jgi:hypothetical protein